MHIGKYKIRMRYFTFNYTPINFLAVNILYQVKCTRNDAFLGDDLKMEKKYYSDANLDWEGDKI